MVGYMHDIVVVLRLLEGVHAYDDKEFGLLVDTNIKSSEVKKIQ